ncbi:MAG: hypothetical protein STHCBS139747_007267 [Sporothrix thermara]
MAVDIVAGGAMLAEGLSVLSANGITAIDTSQTYGNSETILGRVNAGDSFTISTKWGVLEAYTDHSIAWASKEYIIRTARQSIARLGVKQVDIFYLHFPDRNTPLEETLAGVDAAYREGLFRRFGVSNFTAEAVQTIHDIATAKGYVLPTVYQGQYNPVARHFETDLFPTLRKLGMVFYAYSPLAGGFLTKTVEDFYAGKGRFGKQRLLQHIQQTVWEAAARAENVSAAELAYRWDAYHSELSREHGDALIMGGSSLDQLGETARWIKKGKLSDAAVAAIEEVWQSVKGEGPIPV